MGIEPVLQMFRLAASACGTKTGLLPSLYDGMTCTNEKGVLTPQLTSLSDIMLIIGNVLRILMAVAGSLAVVVIIAAALYYISSTGDPARIKRAKDILTTTTIGLMATIMAYAAVTFIAARF